jgi:hypothetical protein
VHTTGDPDFWRSGRGELRCTGASPRTYPPDADAEGYTYWCALSCSAGCAQLLLPPCFCVCQARRSSEASVKEALLPFRMKITIATPHHVIAMHTCRHRDDQSPDQWPFPTGRQIKMFLAISDVAPDGGPLAVVPGSHRLKYGPWETLRRSFRSSMTLDAELPQASMPNHVRFMAKAGDALLFDHGTWVSSPLSACLVSSVVDVAGIIGAVSAAACCLHVRSAQG